MNYEGEQSFAAVRNPDAVYDESVCLEWCRTYPAATACRFTSGQWCYVITSPDVAKGAGSEYTGQCWVFSKCRGKFKLNLSIIVKYILKVKSHERIFIVTILCLYHVIIIEKMN